MCLGLRLHFKLFPNSLRYWKLRIANVALVGHNFSSLWKWWNIGVCKCWLRLYFQISPNSLISWKVIFLSSIYFHMLSDCKDTFKLGVCRRAILWLNCQFSRKEIVTNVYATNLCCSTGNTVQAFLQIAKLH